MLDVATGEVLDGPVDRCRYSPVAWLPGGDELFYVRRLAPDQVPAGEEQFHRRVWRHRVGADRRRPTCWSTARAATRRPTSACTPAATAAGWSSPARPAPPRATTSGSPTSPATATLREFQVGVDAQTAAWVARDGRLWLMSDRDTPRWRLAVADPADPATWAPEAWQDVVPQQPDAVLSDVALVDGPDGGLQVLAVHAVDATDRLSVWAADGSGRLAEVDRPRRGQRLRRQRAAGGRDDGVGRLHRLRDPAVGAALGRRRRRPR